MPISGTPVYANRGTIRQTVTTWFASPPLPGLTAVKRAKPRNVKPGAYFANAGDKTGAIAYVYMEGEHERRVASPVHDGWKQVLYVVGLRITFRSLLNDTEAGIDAYDALIDAVKVRLRSDPQLGTGGYISFAAGEGDMAGAPDIEVIADDSKESSTGTTTIESVVRFQLVSMIQA